MTKKNALEEILERARHILKDSKLIDSDEDIDNILSLIRNSPEAKKFLGGEK